MNDVRLTPHFWFSEFQDSDKAERLRIDNTIPLALYDNVEALANTMEWVRAKLGGNIVQITSGYRCLALNRALKSKDTSHHVKAAAADFVARGYGDPYSVCLRLVEHMAELGIGQLIHEFGRWTHIGILPVAEVNRVLTIDRLGTRVGLHPAR